MIEFRDPDTPLTEDQMLNRKQILEQITSTPETFSMSYWDSRIYSDGFTIALQEESCGTTRCIAGWAIHFAGINILRVCTVNEHENIFTESIIQAAVNVMGLTRDEYSGKRPEEELFYTSNDDAVERMRELAG